MEKITLIEFCRNVCLYFERKPVSNETLEQWFEEIGNIPAEPLGWIAKRIKNLESFPRNLPGTVKALWSEWIESNPNKQVKEREYGCSNCNQGYIQVAYLDKHLNRYYNTMFRCGYCRPLYPESMAVSTVASLKEQGYYRPLGYLSSWKYADSLPSVEDIPIKTVSRKPVERIVKDLAAGKEFPF